MYLTTQLLTADDRKLNINYLFFYLFCVNTQSHIFWNTYFHPIQAKRIHRVCFPHPSTVLAAAGLPDSLCPAPGLYLLHAHPSRRRLPHRWSPYRHPHWFPRAVKGQKCVIWPSTLICLIHSHFNDLFDLGLDLFRPQCCTCAPCSTPSCLLNSGPSTVSRQLLLHPCRTRTRQSFPLVPSLRV